MGRPRAKATECNFKEKDRRLKELTINGINNQVMMAEIINELSTIRH